MNKLEQLKKLVEMLNVYASGYIASGYQAHDSKYIINIDRKFVYSGGTRVNRRAFILHSSNIYETYTEWATKHNGQIWCQDCKLPIFKKHEWDETFGITNNNKKLLLLND